MIDYAVTNKRLARLLRWLAPTIVSFAVIFAVIGWYFDDWRTIASAGAIALHGLLTQFARIACQRQRTVLAAYLAGGGGLASILLALLHPALYTGLAVVPLLIAAMLLQYVPPSQARYYLSACFAVTLLNMAIGVLLPAETHLPPLVNQTLQISTLLAIIFFALLLLGQFNGRLQSTLEQLSGAYITLQDKHAELARLSAQHALILNSAGEGIYGVDSRGTITFANPAAARMFGCAVADLVGQRSPQALAGPAAPLLAVLRDGVIRRHADETFWRTDRTSFPVEYVIAPIGDAGAIAGAVVLFRDITERVQAQAALEAERALLARRVEERTADLSAANAELARAARLKDEFLANMSHELRTPLNAILGMAEALQEGCYEPLADTQQRPIRIIEESGRHLLALINDILDLAKVGAGKLELEQQEIEVRSVCDASLQFVRQQAHAKRITLTSNIDPQIRLVHADARRLKQILINLLSNAVKFTPAGGAVQLSVNGDPADQVIRFAVSDTGIGIAEEQLSRLFQPFVQLDSRLNRQYAGTGLGLVLVARLIELHGGSIAVESTLGQGSKFTIALPWSEMSKPDSTIAQSLLPAGARVTAPFVRRALIVGDSPTTVSGLTRYLAELGVEPHVYSDGSTAAEQVLSLHPDVILLDLQLPGCSGWDVLARLKADPRTRAIPVLIISLEDQRQRAAEAGAAGYLIKPIMRSHLRQALAAVIPPNVDRVVQMSFDATPLAPVGAQALVLLAEDNDVNSMPVVDYLGMHGYRVVVARNGVEAVRQARELVPDIIIMDIQMPELDGLEATRRIRADAKLAATPIIAVTAFAMPGDRERCLAAGANDYLSKPVSLKALRANIEALLAGLPETLVIDHRRSAPVL